MKRRHLYSSKAVPTGNGNAIIARAFQALAEECKLAKVNTAWLVLPTKSNLDGYISETIGAAVTKALGKGQSVPLTDGIQLQMYTMQTLPFGGRGYPILGIYLDDKSLSKIDGKDNIPSIIAIPWIDKDLEKWKILSTT